MLSLKQVKELLDDPTISDDQALEIRDQFYSLVEIIFEQWQEQQKKRRLQNSEIKNPQFNQ